MRFVIPAVALLLGSVACFAQKPAEHLYDGLLVWPSATGGYVMSWDSPREYTQAIIYGSDGKVAFSDQLRKPDDEFCLVWAVDSDGVSARGCDSRAVHQGSIDFLDSSGHAIRTIKTGSYLPQHMAFAPDHSLWVVGYPYPDAYTRDFDVVHHYSRTGEALGRALAWEQIAGNENAPTALALVLGGERMFAGNDRIGFSAYTDSGYGTWIEISPAGDLLAQYDLAIDRSLYFKPAAMTLDGAVYARVWKNDQRNGWAVLDRTEGTWRIITNAPQGDIIGSDGNNLVFARREGNSTVLVHVSADALHTVPPQVIAVASVQSGH